MIAANDTDGEKPASVQEHDRRAGAASTSQPPNALRDEEECTRKEAEALIEKLASEVTGLWLTLKKQPLDSILFTLSKLSEKNLLGLFNTSFPERLDAQRTMELIDGVLDAQRPQSMEALRYHNVLPWIVGKESVSDISDLIASRCRYPPDQFVIGDKANLRFGRTLGVFETQVGRKDFLVELDPWSGRIHSIEMKVELVQRPGVYAFEEAVCILQSQATIYQGLTRLIKTLALATVVGKNDFTYGRATPPMTWKLGFAHAAKLANDHLTTIKAKSSRLCSAAGRLEHEIKRLAVSMSQAAAKRTPLSIPGPCCSLDLERHERLLSIYGLAMDLDNLCEQVKKNPAAWSEAVRLSLELIESDCIWIVERLAYQVTYAVFQSSALSLSMSIPEPSDQTSLDEWEALRKQQPLAWLLQRLHGARGDLIELIKLLLQYIDTYADQFHSRIETTVDDLRLIKDVLVATEGLRPSHQDTLGGED